MPTHVALLRGVNVGGRNKLPMADLRAVVTALGHREVSTYLQSGNVLFTPTGDNDENHLAAALARALAGRMGLQVPVVVLARERVGEVLDGNPFAAEPNPKAVHAVFLAGAPDPAGVAAVAAAVDRARAKGARDDAQVVGRAVYLWTPDGFGRSELAARLTAAAAPLPGTARNWATVTRLVELLGS